MKKKKFSEEFSNNLRYGIFAIGILLIFMAGYYFHAVNIDFDNECASCKTSIDCMDSDFQCGDFGIYYFKFASLIGMGFFGFMLIFIEKEGVLMNG